MKFFNTLLYKKKYLDLLNEYNKLKKEKDNMKATFHNLMFIENSDTVRISVHKILDKNEILNLNIQSNDFVNYINNSVSNEIAKELLDKITVDITNDNNAIQLLYTLSVNPPNKQLRDDHIICVASDLTTELTLE